MCLIRNIGSGWRETNRATKIQLNVVYQQQQRPRESRTNFEHIKPQRSTIYLRRRTDDQNLYEIITHRLNDAVEARVVQSGSRRRINFIIAAIENVHVIPSSLR